MFIFMFMDVYSTIRFSVTIVVVPCRAETVPCCVLFLLPIIFALLFLSFRFVLFRHATHFRNHATHINRLTFSHLMTTFQPHSVNVHTQTTACNKTFVRVKLYLHIARMKSAHMVLKRHVNQLVDIYGDVVSSITPSSD